MIEQRTKAFDELMEEFPGLTALGFDTRHGSRVRVLARRVEAHHKIGCRDLNAADAERPEPGGLGVIIGRHGRHPKGGDHRQRPGELPGSRMESNRPNPSMF
jgi:hypothetical protein